jgi:hypothetical protein
MTPISVERWRCIKVASSPYKDIGGKVFVVGYSPLEDSGFISAPVKAYKSATGIVTTTEGQIIQLVGEPGQSRDADALWRHFIKRHRVREEQDVSSRYLRKA